MKTRIAFILLAVLILASAAWKFSYTYRNGHEWSHSVSKPASILLVGDMMFDRYIRKTAEVHGGYSYTLDCVKDYLSGFDAAVGNLEGPITDNPSMSASSTIGELANMTFTFAPELAKALSGFGFKAIDIGNNHILNFGRSGADATEGYLREAGIQPFGKPDGEKRTIIDANGTKIGLASFNEFMGQNDAEKTVQDIWELKKEASYVVVFSHWGEEYLPETNLEKALAHRFIDAGADLVVGAHPHIVQAHEAYKGKDIYYSLGNFVFDQYWMPEVSTGLGLELSFLDGNPSIAERRFEMKRDGRTCLAR